jgi:sarcosine oxidase subunit gamma
MLETKLAARRTVLSDSVADLRSGVSVRPDGPRARFLLRLPADVAAATASLAGFGIDQPLGRGTAAPERLSARLGPDEWLLVGPEADAEAIAGAIEEALRDQFFALVDIGHRQVGIEVAGADAAAVINAGCPLDLGAAAFPVGAATRTLFGKAEAVLFHLAPGRYRIECWRSFATYVHAFLREAAQDYPPR